jgi:hypothetical protein
MAGARRQDDVVIREREAADDDAIRRLNGTGFGGTDESKLIADLRAAGLAAVERVALEDTIPVGHILYRDRETMHSPGRGPVVSSWPHCVCDKTRATRRTFSTIARCAVRSPLGR